MNDTMIITGAYGRRYQDSHSAVVDFINGKDFRMIGGRYMSVRDLKLILKDGWDTLVIDFDIGAISLDIAELIDKIEEQKTDYSSVINWIICG